MSNFIKVKDRKYGATLLLNIDSISFVSIDGGTVLLNGTHGEQSGLMGFDQENLQKIVDAIEAKHTNEEREVK